MIIGYSAYAGYRRGIIVSAVKLALLFTSIFLAKLVTNAIYPMLAETLPMPGVGTKLASYLNINEEQLRQLSLSEILSQWGFPEKVANSIENAFVSGAGSANRSLSGKITPAIDSLLTQVIVFMFVFFVFWLVSMLLTTLVKNALELPGLNIINRVTGLAAGLLCGLLTVYIISLVTTWGLPLLDASFDTTLTDMVLSKSHLLKSFGSLNLFSGLLG